MCVTTAALSIFHAGEYFFFFKKTGQLLVPDNELKDVKPFKLHCSFTDRQDQYWLPTNNGVLIVNNRKNRFEHYFTRQQIEAPGEDANPVRGIYADTSGNVYATILKNLMWHNTTGNIKSFLTDGHNFSLLRAGNYLVSGNAKKMITYHLSSSRINTYMGSGKADVWSMMEVAPGKILFNSSGQLFTWIVASDKIHSCPQKEKSVLGDIYRLFRTSDNKIYAASDKGMYVLNEEGCLAEHYHSKATDPAHRIPVDGLHWIFEDAHGIFWFLTANDGLYRWNRKENSQASGNKNLLERFRHFTMEDGLSSNVLYCMLQDEHGYLWMSSDFGLMRMDTLSFGIKTFTSANGLSHNEFNRISCYKTANGKMYFGGLNGVNAFNPKDFWNDTTDYDLPVQIISFSQFNSVSNKLEDRTQQLLVENKIELQPEDKFMELKFMLLDYDFSPNRYAYRIDGIDNDWVYISENSIRLTDLPPGKFILRIKGQNQEGNWSPREQIIPITVYAPFYKTIWFMIFCLAALCFAIFLFFRRRTRNIIKAKNWLEQTVAQRTTQMRKLVSEKEMLMKEIHHRVKNNLQVISSLLEMQSSRTKDKNVKSAITETQNRVLSIAFIHQNLYQHEDLKGVEIASFVRELIQLVKNVYSKPGIEIEVVNNIPEIFLDIDTAVPLGLILNELLTNSYKYAFTGKEKGLIEIELKPVADGEYVLVYLDDGTGLPIEMDVQKTNSLGLRLIKQLTRQLAGEIKYSNESGSRFELNLKTLETRNKIK